MKNKGKDPLDGIDEANGVMPNEIRSPDSGRGPKRGRGVERGPGETVTQDEDNPSQACPGQEPDKPGLVGDNRGETETTRGPRGRSSINDASEVPDFKDVWREIIEFNEVHFPGWDTLPPAFLTNALSGEAGELIETVLSCLNITTGIGTLCETTKSLAGGGTKAKTFTQEDIKEELADVFIYLVILSERMRIDESEFISAVKSKQDKVWARKGGRS